MAIPEGQYGIFFKKKVDQPAKLDGYFLRILLSFDLGIFSHIC